MEKQLIAKLLILTAMVTSTLLYITLSKGAYNGMSALDVGYVCLLTVLYVIIMNIVPGAKSNKNPFAQHHYFKNSPKNK